MEKLAHEPGLGIEGVAVPMAAGWSDVGAWDALQDVMDKDVEGNVSYGDTVLEGCSNSLLYGSGRLVAGSGLNDVIVVETADAVSVADKSSTQGVKKIVSRLKAEGCSLADSHRTTFRPWNVRVHRFRRTLSGEAHRRNPRGQTQPADASPSGRTLDRRQGDG